MKTKYIEKFIKTKDGLKISYNLLGFGNKDAQETSVFLHGLGGDLAAWDKIRESLDQKRHPSVAIDLRGHGLSDRPNKNSDYDFDLIVGDVLSVIEKEGLGNVILVGHCFGGMIAQQIGIKNLPQIKKLVLVSTSCKPFKIMKKIKLSSAILKLAKLFENYLFQIHKNGRINHRKFVGTGDFNFLRIISDLKHTSINSYGHIFSKVHNFDLSEEIIKIKIETKIIVGDNDKIFPKESSVEIKKLVPNSSLEVVSGADHMIVFNYSERVLEAIIQSQ
jgi:pimeloyl-ACP methyl ester carboxylesterase